MVGESARAPAPVAVAHKRWLVVINPKAGTAARAGVEDPVGSLRAETGRRGVEVTVLEDLGDLPDAIEAERFDAVIAAGGDGTVNSVAAVLAGQSEAPALGVLPLGTFNNFARSVGMPSDWGPALAALTTAEPEWLTVGIVQGSGAKPHVFLNIVTMGVHPAMVKERDARLKTRPQGKLLGKWPAMVAAGWQVFRRFPKHRVTLSMPGREQTVRTPGVYICREAAKLESVGVEVPREGKGLALLIGKTQSRMQSLWLLLRALFGCLPGAGGYEVAMAESLTLSMRSPHFLDLAVDGEHRKVKTPVEFSLRPRGLRVLVPRGDSR